MCDFVFKGIYLLFFVLCVRVGLFHGSLIDIGMHSTCICMYVLAYWSYHHALHERANMSRHMWLSMFLFTDMAH